MKKIYAVLCITKSATVNNEIVKLDEGNYIIPAFDDYEKTQRKPTYFSRWMNLVNNFLLGICICRNNIVYL